MNEELSEPEGVKNPLDVLKTTFTNFEWGISLSVGGYLFLIFIGLSYSFFYFMTFRINIFLFSEINDFLMSPLANPLVIVFGMLSIGLVYFLYYLDFVWRKKDMKTYRIFYRITMFGMNPDNKKAKENLYSPPLIMFMLVLYLFSAAMFYAIHRSEKTVHDKNLYHYKLSIDSTVIKNTDSLVYVGDNSGHYFLYDTIRRQATVIPKEQVKFVTIMKNPKGKFF